MTTALQSEKITLYFRQGSSDKVYNCSLDPSGTGFVVNFAYGRRGSTMQTGSKTTAPVDYAAAKKIYDKLVAEKTAKGYTPGEDGTPYQQTGNESRATGILPQLLNSISEEQAALLLPNPDWWAQEKFDGKRVLLQKSGDTLIGINRKGLTIALPQPILEQAAHLGDGQWILDGEAIGDTFVVFDLLEHACVNLRGEPYNRRLKALYDLVANDPKQPLYAAETAMGTTAKRAMWDRLKQQRREGVVFKRRTALYMPGRPNSGGDALKLKFTATASCVVVRSKGAKRSVMLTLLSDTGATVEVGAVTIPPNHQIPKVGAVVEIRYLYAYPGGSLYQPVYLGPRDDVDPTSCTMAQLKYKAGTEDDAEG
jgi:bifunctional non-homologous end joining protein LigD